MIAIAQKRNENCTFILGGDFNLEKQVDAIIITGRSTRPDDKYDLNETFASLFNNITGRHNCFDFIDANRFIPYINENQKIIQSRVRRNKLHKESHWEMTTLDNFMLDGLHYTFINGKKDLIANDFSTVRVFTLNEIQLFLYLNNFEI
jgi:hypothetical protein